MIDQARHRVLQWLHEDRIASTYADAWLDLLSGSVPEVRHRIGEDSDHMADLRQSSPFAGTLSEAERQKIFAGVH